MNKFKAKKLFGPMRFVALPVLLFTMLCQTSASQTTGWDFKGEKDGIYVYTRSLPDSQIVEFCGLVTIEETSLAALCSVMNSFHDYKNWIYQCLEGKSLERLNDQEGHAYIIYHIGWPIADRDLILKYKMAQNTKDKTVTISMHADPAVIPEKAEYVRIYRANGHWKFTPAADRSVLVEYQLHMEPRGDLHPLIVNEYAHKIPYQTLRKLRCAVKKHSSASSSWLR